MKTALFLRTFDGDAEWLHYCLRATTKYCRGYSFLAIVYQPGSLEAKKEVRRWKDERGHRIFPDGIREYDDTEGWDILQGNGYLHQQVSKMRADQFVPPETDYISHYDSDCTFLEEHTPEIYIRDGKPLMLYTPYSFLQNATPWEAPTSNALGEPVESEFMRRFPITYPVALYDAARKHLKGLHNRTLSDFVKTSGVFSEFNYMGAYAWKFMHDQFRWLHTEQEDFGSMPLKQYWSHGGVTPQFREELNAVTEDWNKR